LTAVPPELDLENPVSSPLVEESGSMMAAVIHQVEGTDSIASARQSQGSLEET
jgi:hypothetical protein